MDHSGVKRIDIGLFSDNPKMPDFYSDDLGLPYITALEHSPTYREMFWSVDVASLKINYSTEPMGEGSSGYRGLIIAREGLETPRSVLDPDGLDVSLVPPGHEGVTGLGIVYRVADPQAQRQFLIEGLGATEDGNGLWLGGTKLVIEEAPGAPEPGPTWTRGFNYMAPIVSDGLAVYERMLAAGAEPGVRPLRLDYRCLFAWVRDPNGNWIEVVQYGPGQGPYPELEADSPPLPELDALSDHWEEIIRWREQGTPV